jgi:hypothetical protein
MAELSGPVTEESRGHLRGVRAHFKFFLYFFPRRLTALITPLSGSGTRGWRGTEDEETARYLLLSGSKPYDLRICYSLVQHVTTLLIMDDFCARYTLPLTHFNNAPIDAHVSFQSEREIVA